MKIKGMFAGENSLLDYLHSNIENFLSTTKATVGHLEPEYLLAKKETLKGWLVIIAAFIVIWGSFYFLDEDSSFDLSGVGVTVIIFVIIGSFIAIYKAWRLIQRASKVIVKFNQELNKFLWPMIFKIFALDSEVIPGEVLWASQMSSRISYTINQSDISSVLMGSELITEKFNTSTVDDVIVTSLGNNKLKFAELDIKNITGSGKNRQVKNIFKGYFVEFDLDINLKGKTFVSTDGDRKGFGHQSFWDKFTKNGDEVRPTQLEWNQFEDLLHVATSDPTEARYVLSPSFMNDLYKWWSGRKMNIRISFIGNKMYMLFPDKNVQFGRTIGKISEGELLTYLEKIAPPVMHILHLVEDVQLQFNR